MTDTLTGSTTTPADAATADESRGKLTGMHLFSTPTAADPFAELARRIGEQVRTAADASATAARAILGR